MCCVREETCKPEYNLKGTTKGITWQRSTERKTFYRIKTNRCLQWEKGKVAQSSTSGQYCHVYISANLLKDMRSLIHFLLHWERNSIKNRMIAKPLKSLKLCYHTLLLTWSTLSNTYACSCPY